MKLIRLHSFPIVEWKSIIVSEMNIERPIEFEIPLGRTKEILSIMKELKIPWMDGNRKKGGKFFIGPLLRIYNDGYILRKRSVTKTI